jgi:transcription initiation factor TFIIIB Brf1 subunit/transcription initiation factor TFIIB
MTTKTIDESPVWKQFETEAKKRRRNPVKLVLDYVKEQVEIWEHEKLDDEISIDAQKSGYTEDDAVELVKQYRLEKKQRAIS